MTPDERQFYASEVIKECMVKARAAYPNATLVEPPLDFKLRGRCAGQAFYDGRISLNPHLFDENFDAFVKQTIPHEVAHIVAYVVYGKSGRGHGHFWRLACRAVGLEYFTDRCHKYVAPTWKARKQRIIDSL